MLGKRVKVTVGNDNWGEVINTNFPHLVTVETSNEYGLSPVFNEFTDRELVEKGYHKFTVNKDSVEVWKD